MSSYDSPPATPRRGPPSIIEERRNRRRVYELDGTDPSSLFVDGSDDSDVEMRVAPADIGPPTEEIRTPPGSLDNALQAAANAVHDNNSEYEKSEYEEEPAPSDDEELPLRLEPNFVTNVSIHTIRY